MGNRFKDGQRRLAEVFKDKGSESVVYRRRDQSIEALQATPAMPDQLMTDFAGASLRKDRREWLITAADLRFNGELTTPQINDSIDVTDVLGITRRYLISKDGELPEYEAADTFGVMLRIRGVFQKVLP